MFVHSSGYILIVATHLDIINSSFMLDLFLNLDSLWLSGRDPLMSLIIKLLDLFVRQACDCGDSTKAAKPWQKLITSLTEVKG